MPLPNDFNPFEHLQSVLIKVHNKQVRDFFNDVPENDIDINTPRGSLKQACLLRDDDNAEIMQLRYWLFYLDIRQGKDLQAPLCAIPLDDVQSSRKYKPQITLFFREDLDDVEPDERAVWGEISFRLMNESSTTITKTELERLGREIKSKFGAGAGYLWKKGKKLFTYVDREKGYSLQVLCRTDTDAKDLIRDVLSIQSHTIDNELLKSHLTEDETGAYPYTPGTQSILGKSRKKPRRRPNVDVRFQYATCTIHGVNKPICLYDRSFTHLDPLVS